MKNNVKIIIIVLAVILILGTSCFVVYQTLQPKLPIEYYFERLVGFENDLNDLENFDEDLGTDV